MDYQGINQSNITSSLRFVYLLVICSYYVWLIPLVAHSYCYTLYCKHEMVQPHTLCTDLQCTHTHTHTHTHTVGLVLLFLEARRATVNGLVPPQTYQRQRAVTRRSRTSSAGSSTTAWTDASASAPGGGTAARGKGAKEKSQLLCPLRHREEEACSYCMSR